ncbi:unnamed protein product [Camellia sinensis]
MAAIEADRVVDLSTDRDRDRDRDSIPQIESGGEKNTRSGAGWETTWKDAHNTRGIVFSFDLSLSYEKREKRKRQVAERA